MHCAADTMRSAADMMAQWVRPPYMEKNKLILNEYLGIFRPYLFLNTLWKMTFFKPYPPKCGKFHPFFNPYHMER